MKKILVCGSSGFVGDSLFRELSRNYLTEGLSRSEKRKNCCSADASERTVLSFLDKSNPDVVIHAIKLRKSVDYYETNKEESRKIEVESARNLAEWCSENNKKAVLISTDYVYSGKTGNYDEDSITNPVNYYGEVKLEVEQIFKQARDSAILRTTVVFGYHLGGNNFLMQLLGLNKKITVPYDQISNPTPVEVLVRYTEGIIQKNLSGLFVATGPETIGRYDLAIKIADIFSLDKNLIERKSTEEIGQIARRPLNNGTNSSKIRKYLDYEPPSITDYLESLRRKI